ncbi:MAG: DUF2809 domain-containing protein [bacterium]|nr:DUF2809 domain-containing protein [bacterium]
MNRTAKRHLFGLLLVVPVGFSTKFYSGHFESWVRNSSGGILYVIFWIWLIGLLRPRGKPWIMGALVFTATTAIEFLQLWHHSILENIRATFIGRTLLGTSFTWTDLPYYAIGTVLGVTGTILMRVREEAGAWRQQDIKTPDRLKR